MKLKIAIMGAGSLGCFFGACLTRAGNDVTFIARGATKEALRKNGVTINSKELGDFTTQVKVTDKPDEVGPVDLIVFCVKTYDLESAAQQLQPLIGLDTLIIPVQNGVDASERIASVVGVKHVLGAVTWTNASAKAPGVITHGGSSRLIFGDLYGVASDKLKQILMVLHDAGLSGAEVHPHVKTAIWEKFVTIAAVNAVLALVRLPAGPVQDCPETWDLLRGAMEENAAVASAAGVSLPKSYVDDSLRMLRGYAAYARPSMLVDLTLGRRLELEAMIGAVVRLGKELGVETPINYTIYRALKPYENGSPPIPVAP